MKDILTSLTERLGQKLNNDINKIGEIDEGMSMNDFKKMMNKFKKSGINFNRMSAQQLMYTLYNTMDSRDFKALDAELEKAKAELKRQPIDCGGGYSCGGGRSSGGSSCGDGYSCGSSRSRRSYSCGYDDDRC